MTDRLTRFVYWAVWLFIMSSAILYFGHGLLTADWTPVTTYYQGSMK